jgi:hypothetical protein
MVARSEARRQLEAIFGCCAKTITETHPIVNLQIESGRAAESRIELGAPLESEQ